VSLGDLLINGLWLFVVVAMVFGFLSDFLGKPRK
jgi:hypothetical protein